MDPRPALVLALVLLAAAPTALAHVDAPVGPEEEPFSLSPGESRAFPFFVHYHRLIGRVIVEGDAPVRLAIYDEAAHQALVAGAPAESFWRSGPLRGEAGLNVLVDCCDGTGDERYHLVASHAGGAGVAHVRLSAKTVHDDLLVGTSGAEGDAFQNAFVFWLVGGVFGVQAMRAARGRDPARLAAGELARLARQSAVVAAAPFAVAGVAAAWGALRYGGGAVAGLVASFGVVFPSFGAAVLVGLFLAAWAWAAALWLKAYRAALAGAPGARLVVAVGLAEALAFGAAPFLLVPEYGARVLAMGPLMALPLVAVMAGVALHLALRARRLAPGAGSAA